MRKGHYITLIVAVAIIAALYWGANTVPPKQAPENNMPAAGAGAPAATDMVAAASTDSILDASQNSLPPHAQAEVNDLVKTAANSQDKKAGADYYTQAAKLYQQHDAPAAAAYYYAEAAKLDNSEKSLNFAGQFNLGLLHNAQSAPVRAWAAQQAIASFEQSLQLNPDNDTVKMALASCYIDGTATPMQGIQLLLGITRNDPDNIPANLMLGQLSVRSGQLDKAIERFETVLKNDPDNTEALYFLAEVYKNKGDKEKAIELLEKCKKIINNPKFSKDIDEYINSFK